VTALAARAALALAGLAALVLVVRRRTRPAAAPEPVAVLARAPLGPGIGVALVEAGGRRLLLGFGRDGVRLVRDLGPGGGPP
jgi:flagellar biogenesis protein FliO